MERPDSHQVTRDQAVAVFTVMQKTHGAQEAQASAIADILGLKGPLPEPHEEALKAVADIIDGASLDDVAELKKALINWRQFEQGRPVSRDEELVKDWRTAPYPYKNRLARNVLNAFEYDGKDPANIGVVDSLIVNRAEFSRYS